MEMSLNRMNEADEARLIADLAATFPGTNPRSLRQWSGRSTSFGACVCGEAVMPDGCEIGPYIFPDSDEYDGWVHAGFEAWVEARGWYVELYEPGALHIVPIPAIAIAVDEINRVWYPPPSRPVNVAWASDLPF